MNGLRRTEEGPDASERLGKISLDHRGVQILDKGASAAGKAGGAAQGAYTSFVNDDDLSDSGDDAVRNVPGKLKRAGSARGPLGGKATKAAKAKSSSAAGAAKSSGRGAGGAVNGQIRTRGIASTTRKAGKVPVQAGTTASRGAIAASRAAATVANTVRVVAAAITTTLTSSPVALVVTAIIAVVVLIISIVGWLIPGVQQERGHDNYGVGVAPGPWGGYSNGFIPEERLTEIPWAPGRYLRSDAVTSLVALNEDFKSKFGYNIGISDAYRDFAGQVEAKRKYGDGAAEPGTSDHGWALAVDFGTGIASFGTQQYRWMKDNGPEYGWRHPAWAEPNGRLPEPWHWEFWGWAAPGSETPIGGSPSDAKAYARQALGNSLQFQCLERLWTGESNWNPLAKNASSGAYGIPQALPGEKLASAGADWLTNGVTQVKWGLRYIQDRYGTPCDAWSFWQSKNPHWY